MGMSMYQFQSEMKVWVENVDTWFLIDTWIRKNLKLLYIISIVTGSTFCSVTLCNTNLFGLGMHI